MTLRKASKLIESNLFATYTFKHAKKNVCSESLYSHLHHNLQVQPFATSSQSFSRPFLPLLPQTTTQLSNSTHKLNSSPPLQLHLTPSTPLYTTDQHLSRFSAHHLRSVPNSIYDLPGTEGGVTGVSKCLPAQTLVVSDKALTSSSSPRACAVVTS